MSSEPPDAAVPKLSTDFQVGDIVKVAKAHPYSDTEDWHPLVDTEHEVDSVVPPRIDYPTGLLGIKCTAMRYEPEYFELAYRPRTRAETEAFTAELYAANAEIERLRELAVTRDAAYAQTDSDLTSALIREGELTAERDALRRQAREVAKERGDLVEYRLIYQRELGARDRQITALKTRLAAYDAAAKGATAEGIMSAADQYAGAVESNNADWIMERHDKLKNAVTALAARANPPTDALIDELWGRLCPDMGVDEWRDWVNGKGVIDLAELRTAVGVYTSGHDGYIWTEAIKRLAQGTATPRDRCILLDDVRYAYLERPHSKDVRFMARDPRDEWDKEDDE